MTWGAFPWGDKPLGALPTVSSGAVNYTLSGASGAYAVTGNAATFKVSHVLSGAAGSYAVTGNAATFNVGHALSGASGSYAVTGYAATLVRTSTGPTAYAITGDPGAYLLAGNDAGFDWSGAIKPIQYYGGGPGKLKGDKSSYWHRLLSPPVLHKLEELEPEVAEAIEVQAVAVVEQQKPKKDAQAEMRRAMEDMGIAYKQAYKEIYLELVAEMQQAQEDEQIAQIVAMLI